MFKHSFHQQFGEGAETQSPERPINPHLSNSELPVTGRMIGLVT
jgi:hypothetical protein